MKKLIALTLALLLLAGCAPAVYDGPTVTKLVLAEDRTTHYDPDTGETHTTLDTYSYDSYGNQVRSSSYEGEQLMYESRYTYDDQYNCLREVTYERFWLFLLPTSRTYCTYDDQGQSLSTIYRNGFGIKTGEEHFTRDEEANTITWDSTYDTQTIYFDENGDSVRTETLSKLTGSQTETFEEFDELGRTIKTTEYMDGDLFSTTEYRYDDEGRLAELTSYGSRGQVLSGFTMLYEENTVTTLYRDGYKQVETLRPDGLVQTVENYSPAGELRSKSEYTYTQIQIPAEEE